MELIMFHCGHAEADHTEADGGESRCPHCDCPEYIERRCPSCNGMGFVCDESARETEKARRETRGYIQGCVTPSHPGYRLCPECASS